jgi:hypothetical protein
LAFAWANAAPDKAVNCLCLAMGLRLLQSMRL